MVQPFERLRSLARSGDADETLLVEIAACLADFEDDPAGLVVACRSLLTHHRGWAALWWLCSRVLAAPRPGEAATDALAEVAADRTTSALAGALPYPPEGPIAVAGWSTVGAHLLSERADLTVVSVMLEPASFHAPLPSQADEIDPAQLAALAPTHLLVDVAAISDRRVLVRAGVGAALAASPAATRTWAVAPTGSVLPDRLLEAMARAAVFEAGTRPEVFDRIVGPRGLMPPEGLLDRIDAPIAPELLRPLP